MEVPRVDCSAPASAQCADRRRRSHVGLDVEPRHDRNERWLMLSAATPATQYPDLCALIRFEAGGANAEILATGDERSMLALHAERAEYGVGRFYSVRSADNDLTRLAARTMAEKLGKRQAQGLGDLEADRRMYGRRSVRPGYEAGRTNPRRWRGMYSTDLSEALKSRKLLDYVTITGVPYGPKTYRLTTLGRLIGAAILEMREEQA